MWASQKEPKLKAKDIRTFYSILQIAIEKEQPDPLSLLYMTFVQSVCGLSKIAVDRDALADRIKLQIKKGLFDSRMDPKVIDLIIQDIKQNGEFIKQFLEASGRSNAKSEFISSLEIPKSLVSGTKKRLVSNSSYEKDVSALENEVKCE